MRISCEAAEKSQGSFHLCHRSLFGRAVPYYSHSVAEGPVHSLIDPLIGSLALAQAASHGLNQLKTDSPGSGMGCRMLKAAICETKAETHRWVGGYVCK